MLFEFSEYVVHTLLHKPIVMQYFPYHKRHHRKYCREHDYVGTTWVLSIIQMIIAFSVVICTSKCVIQYIVWSVFVYNTMHSISHGNIWTIVRDYHLAHHRDSSKNIGVSSPLMDWLCDTLHKDFNIQRPILLLLPPPLSFMAVTHNKR
jgi:hypothetical protein